MFVKKKIDYYPITVVLLLFAIDISVFFLSPSVWFTLLWSACGLYLKGAICCWNHNHQHNNFFKVAWANRLLEFILGLQTGIVGEAWVLHHTRGHHLNYLDQSKDESAWKSADGRTMGRIEYTFRVTTMAYPLALKVGQNHPKSRKKLVENLWITGGIVGILMAINWVNALILFAVPMVILLTMTISTTYDHHSGLDTDNPYEATYNITNRWYNLLTCNLGYHTAHHLQCARHWSQLPQLHEEIKDKIPSTLYREAGFPFNMLEKIEESWFKKPQQSL
ncbi:MAG: fatty acid desaturase [Acaryochloridaceae cyanobacterium RL_2_7]|nr:fatty acid desaturase [Acaryochloridaceae cyanobacterium RL_2_7]